MQIQIPEKANEIIATLAEAGYEAYVVGGCVRDAILGREAADWDITTNARPEQVKALFPRTVDTGLQHGTVTVLNGKEGFEVTTYRIDGEYLDGRHPEQVLFTPNLLEDLKRRDFTINAMAYNEKEGLVDAFGGIGDLERGQIRCVGDPRERFTEDALRILRAVRFSAQLDFEIEKETFEAISVIAPNLAKVSKERIQMELTKLLCSEHPEKIREVYETGISTYVSPAFAALDWQNARVSAALPKEKYVRWAAFLRCGNSPENAVRVLRDLKLDNETVSRVKTLVTWADVTPAADEAEVRRMMSCMEPEVWVSLMELNGHETEIRALVALIRGRGDCLSLKELAVKGQDLIAAGVKPGKEMGTMLHELLEHVLEVPQDNEKETLLKLLADMHR